jgi:hypothetical protein
MMLNTITMIRSVNPAIGAPMTTILESGSCGRLPSGNNPSTVEERNPMKKTNRMAMPTGFMKKAIKNEGYSMKRVTRNGERAWKAISPGNQTRYYETIREAFEKIVAVKFPK